VRRRKWIRVCSKLEEVGETEKPDKKMGVNQSTIEGFQTKPLPEMQLDKSMNIPPKSSEILPSKKSD